MIQRLSLKMEMGMCISNQWVKSHKIQYLPAYIEFKEHCVICRADPPEKTEEIPPSIQNQSSQNVSGAQPDSDLDR